MHGTFKQYDQEASLRVTRFHLSAWWNQVCASGNFCAVGTFSLKQKSLGECCSWESGIHSLKDGWGLPSLCLSPELKGRPRAQLPRVARQKESILGSLVQGKLPTCAEDTPVISGDWE